MKQEFTIRVYGLIVWKNSILLSTEQLGNAIFTKFPGGGLIWGENTRQCLQREIMEELQIEVEIGRHIYTTDQLIINQFNPNQQVLGVYYQVLYNEAEKIKLNGFRDTETQIIHRSWVALKDFVNQLSFEMDKRAAAEFLANWKNQLIN